MTTTRTVIVTGSSSGIGLGIARAIYEDGGNVVLNGRDSAKLESVAIALGSPDRVAHVPGDMGMSATGEALARAAIDRFGRRMGVSIATAALRSGIPPVARH